MPDPNTRLLAAMRHPADGGPAADHLAESGADLPAALRLFAEGTLSREGLAEFCPQAGEIADGKARRQAVLGVWFPEAEVLAENILANPAYSLGAPDPNGLKARILAAVRAMLGGKTFAWPDVHGEVAPALAAFRRRVLRLFPEYRRDWRASVAEAWVLDVSRDFPEDSSGDDPTFPASSPAFANPFWDSIVGKFLTGNGFSPKLRVLWERNRMHRVFQFRQDQPVEYLVTPPPPEDWQVGDVIPGYPPELSGGAELSGVGQVPLLVLRRVDAQGFLRIRLPDGRLYTVHTSPPPTGSPAAPLAPAPLPPP